MTTQIATIIRQIGRSAAAVAALLVLAPATTAQAAEPDPQRVVVTFAPDTTVDERTDAIAEAGADTAVDAAQEPALGAAVVLPAVTDAQRDALQRDPDVVAVEDDVPVQADAIAVDPAYRLQDGLREINADDAWDHTTGDDDVVIAVVDTGVDATNPDLAGKLVEGYDFVNDDTDPRDDNGHGTAVATVAAAKSNTHGIAGVCWRCRVMPLKALDENGSGYLSDAAQSINWAVEHGADVVNLSLGGTTRLHAMTAALKAAEKAGVLVVASAGNESTDTPHWPAADPLAVAVAATEDGDRADYSNYGTWIDVAAPGCNPAATLGSGVRSFCGTSSSAPLVAGLAGLAESVDRDVTSGALRDMLTATARPAGADLGAGIVDAEGVITSLLATPPTPTPQPEPTTEPTPTPAPQPEPVTPPAGTFRDIAGNVHADNIRALAASGITSGCTSDAYCPARTVSRGQIATFLRRGLDLPAGSGSFADVPAGHPHAAGIAAVATAHITNGCAPARFCPGAGLTRGQMASLLDRALVLPDGVASFDDVPAGHPHAAGIAAVAAAGITNGCARNAFCPDAPVDRGQMASFLVRALGL